MIMIIFIAELAKLRSKVGFPGGVFNILLITTTITMVVVIIIIIIITISVIIIIIITHLAELRSEVGFSR